LIFWRKFSWKVLYKASSFSPDCKRNMATETALLYLTSRKQIKKARNIKRACQSRNCRRHVTTSVQVHVYTDTRLKGFVVTLSMKQNLLAYPPSGISHLIQHCIIVSHNNESLNNWKGKRCLLRIDSTFWTKNQDCPNNEAHLQDLSLQKSNFEPLLIMGKLICMLSWVQLLFINLEF
jgi:hypothetical protein